MDAVRERFAKTAALVAEREEQRRGDFRERLRSFVTLGGDERVLDAGAGTGALAFALAPLVREVVTVDLVPELLEEGRRRGAEFPNVVFVEGDVMKLALPDGGFDLAGCHRTLHHVVRPELAVAEIVRTTRPGGSVLVIDQIAPADPLAALELNRFERARDPSHTRALSDIDLRGLFESNGLVLRRAEFVPETRELEPYLDLAACEGDARERARAAAPGAGSYGVDIGWYLLVKPGFST
jgi:ubiquinone/menaquinone biosynthesis C-methylase UbiE